MSITEVDELRHTSSDDPVWRESLYFYFHDAYRKIGGMTTIGVLPNQNRAQGYTAIFLGARQVLYFRTESPLDEEKAGLCSVPGIRYEMLTPLQKWRFAVTADFNEIDPYQIVRGVRSPETTVPASFDVSFDALSSAYEFPTDAYGLLAGRARHFEQTGHTDGSISVGGRTFVVRGFGFRDHSWGIRNLPQAGNVVGVYAQLGPHLTVNALWGIREGREIAIGYVSRDGVNTPINEVQVTIEADPLFHLPQKAHAEIGTTDGQRLGLQAKVDSVMPVLMDHGGGQLYWFECATRFRHGEQTGYGTLATTKLIQRC